MSRHTFRLRDLAHIEGQGEVHLDQVHITFRPSSDIQPSEFRLGDNANFSWRAETMQLMVRTTPGVRHVLYTEEALGPILGEGEQVQTSQRSITYSSALSLTPDLDGVEDYWCRTYRPIRDLPITTSLGGSVDLSEFTLELVWPLLQADTRAFCSFVPDYRILKVYCEFSVR